MKLVLILVASCLALTACKKKEEVKIDSPVQSKTSSVQTAVSSAKK